jgi:hypothetical protein
VSESSQSSAAQESDLIDRIASALPVEVRADYYREMRHCRSLPENDEMLRILRAMGFLVLLMVQAPERMATERLRLEEAMADALRTLQEICESSDSHRAQLDQHLVQLPADIAEGINPEAIAATINESLRQQFVQSTIPATAEALAVAAAQIKKATAEFGRSANALGDSYQGAAEGARKAIANLESTSSQAVSSTRRAAEELVSVFREEYRWSVYTLTGLALLIGIGFGMWYQRWIDPPSQPVERAPAVQRVQQAQSKIVKMRHILLAAPARLDDGLYGGECQLAKTGY